MSTGAKKNNREEIQLKGLIKSKPFSKVSRNGDDYFSTFLLMEDDDKKQDIPLIFWAKDFNIRNFDYQEDESEIDKIRGLVENQSITVYGYYTLNNAIFKVTRFEISDLEEEIYV